MWDLIVSVPDHCLSFYFNTLISSRRLMLLKTNFCGSFMTVLGRSFARKYDY